MSLRWAGLRFSLKCRVRPTAVTSYSSPAAAEHPAYWKKRVKEMNSSEQDPIMAVTPSTLDLELLSPSAPRKKLSALRRRKPGKDSGFPKRLFASADEKEEVENGGPEKKQRLKGPLAESFDSFRNQPEVPQVTFKKCYLADLTGTKALHLFLREYCDQEGQEIPAVHKANQRSSMNKMARATLYAVLKRAYNDLIFTSCDGCLLDRPGQNSHDCLHWETQHYDEMLKYVCNHLNMGPLVFLITVMGCMLECFSMNHNHIKSLSNMLQDIVNSPSPSETFRSVYAKCDPDFIRIIENFLNKSFVNHDSITTFT